MAELNKQVCHACGGTRVVHVPNRVCIALGLGPPFSVRRCNGCGGEGYVFVPVKQ